MKLKEFIDLPPEHTISFEESQELHKDIALSGVSTLKSDKISLLLEYLDSCLLRQSVEPALVSKLELVVIELRQNMNKPNVP